MGSILKDKNTGHQLVLRKKIMITAIIFIVVISILLFRIFTMEDLAWTTPNYQKISLSEICKKDILSPTDYNTLLMQTGLGKPAVDKLKETNKNLTQVLTIYQNNFFDKKKMECSKIGVITYEERMVNKKGKIMKAFQVADIKDGDVVLSRSTHSFGWRHGHAAIVTDAKKGELLEATLLGCPTGINDIENWQSYSTFILLRPKTESSGVEAANVAIKNLKDISYGLFSGIPKKGPDKVRKTQCAHLVWYAYYRIGYDIDSDGGWLVTPKDIAHSNLFDIVQVYGVNPKEIWP